MSIETVLRICVAIFIAFVGWWVVKHPNRSKKYPSRIRLPKIIPIVGWLLIVAGAFFGLVTLAMPEPELGMHITAIAMFVGGVIFVLMYRNFYVAPEAEEVCFRTLFGKEKVIAYDQISDVKTYQMNGKPFVKVTANDGTKLDLNPAMYDLSAMFTHLQARGVTPQ